MEEGALPPTAQNQGYSADELSHIYELGRLYLENGDYKRAQTIFFGLTQVAPTFAPAWLGLAAIQITDKQYDEAIHSVSQALSAEPHSHEALIFLAACYLCTGDYNSAGTHLGEIGEKIENGLIDNPYLIRFYKAQLARFQNR